MKPFFAILFLLICGLLCGAELTVLAVSDSHAKCWKWRNLADAVNRHRRTAGTENTLLLDAGDTLQGSWLGTWKNGAIPMAILNELNVDAWVPGNHDFDYAPESFLRFKGALLGGDWQTDRVKPRAWAMFERAGYKIAVIGLGEWGMRRRVLPDAGITFKDPEKVLASAVREALAAGADLLILVQHDGEYGGFGTLHRRLQKFPEIPLVIGAHSHQWVAGKKIGRAWYVQPGCYGDHLAVIKVSFRGKDEVPVITSFLEKTKSPAQYRFRQETFAALQEVSRKGKEVLGNVPGGLAPPDGLYMKGAFGDLAEKALLAETGAGVCIFSLQGGGVRTPDKVTAGDLFRLYPYGGRICSTELTPTELETLIREMIKFQNRREKLSVRYGGVKLYRDKRGRVQKIVLPSAGPDGRILVAMTDYELAGCAGQIPMMQQLLAKGLPYRNTGILLRDAIARRLSMEKNLQSGKKGVSYQQ